MEMGPGAEECASTPFSEAVRAALADLDLVGFAQRDRRLIVLDIDSPDEQSFSMSRFNETVLRIAANLFAHLWSKGIFRDGNVSGAYVTPYSVDRDVWDSHLEKVGLFAKDIPGFTGNLRQGDQADLVVTRFVRGNVDENPFGFFNDARRLNVMTSRAKQYSFCICHLRTWNKS